MFGCLGTNGTVNNLGLVKVDVSGVGNVGGLVGRNEQGGLVQNCYTTGKVRGTGANVGGVVGASIGTAKVLDCWSSADVYGSYNSIGGVVGASSGRVENCYYEYAPDNKVYAVGQYTGGVVGYNNGGTVENCYSKGKVEGNGHNVGGVVGYNLNNGKVLTSYATGSVSSINGDIVGGVVGANEGRVEKCYYEPTIGNGVSGNDHIGGVVGKNIGSRTVTGSYSTGNVTGRYNIGGVVGFNDSANGIVENCYATGSVTGGVSFASTNSVGGVVGENIGKVINCYATGNVSSDVHVGGVVGINNGTASQVLYCYATGTVSGINYIGGVVGNSGDYDPGNTSKDNSGGTVKNNVALNQSVTGTADTDVGRVIGLDRGSIAIANNYGRASGMTGGAWVSDADGNDGEDTSEWNTAAFWKAAGNWDGVTWENSVNSDGTKAWNISATGLPRLNNMPDGAVQ